MSMNLTCHAQGHDVDLWQTPTHITYMCLSYNPKTGCPDGGHEGVRRRYILWVKGQLDGMYPTREAYETQRDWVNTHVEKIQSLKRPRFSYI